MVFRPPQGSAPSAPAPFLKWAGGKRSLLSEILKLVPRRIDTYYEPFVGAGAVFFALAGQKRFGRAVLADVNADLVDAYRAVQSDVEGVMSFLEKMKNDETTYYEIRALEPRKLSLAHRAARLIYLNRTGFNGLYRVNSRGGFNVPFGHYSTRVICREKNLRAASAALQNVELVVGDFEEVLAEVGREDFVYLDPPYVPVSATANFTGYAQSPFGQPEQERLARRLRLLGGERVPALLSNSDCEITRSLYKGLRPRSVEARRPINSDARGRGPVKELLVRSFTFPSAGL